ncbi:hypothetical protein GGR57DRAFT_513657 [Xylariaceae sp. FL1272]|nr:hypothetical protein GGR57DRAFT_513657 [Xylariaceae sp. FL1272]
MSSSSTQPGKALPAIAHLGPRNPSPYVLCFPVGAHSPRGYIARIVDHLKDSYKELCQHEPLLRAMLNQTNDGKLHLTLPSNGSEPLDVNSIEVKEFDKKFNDIISTPLNDVRSTEARALLLRGAQVPVVSPEIWIMEDGLLLFLNIMECIMDRKYTGELIKTFARASRGERLSITPSMPDWISIKSKKNSDLFRSLLSECEEYKLNEIHAPVEDDNRAPCDIARLYNDGLSEFFTLSGDGIRRLANHLAGGDEKLMPKFFIPSTVAIFWAVLVHARYQQTYATGPSSHRNLRALTPVPLQKFPPTLGSKKQQLNCQAVWASVSSVPKTTFETAMNTVIPEAAVQSLITIASRVDEALASAHTRRYVKKRLDLVEAAPDSRDIGLNFDPNDTNDFLCDPYIVETEWNLGQGGPDIRPLTRLCALPPPGSASIVSAGRDIVVQITLEAESMERLKRWDFSPGLKEKGFGMRPLGQEQH